MNGIRRAVVRFGMMASLAVAIMATVLAPQLASAATARHISLSAYTTNQRCWVDAGEQICEKKFDMAYQMLQVSGAHFTKMSPVYIQATAFGAIPDETGSVVTDAYGNFVFKSKQIELCQAGVPVAVQALDMVTGQWSNVATIIACAQ